ncbi:MAG: TldD/PmbA family protein, partial [Acidimicrobiia bacterium]
AHQTSVSLAALSGAVVGAESADRARRGREAVEVPPADYEVVLEPECVATIALFLAAYGLNAKAVDEGLSALRPGQERFDPAFWLIDDATAPDALGLPFDAEGTPKRRVDLVSAGTVASLAHDLRTAKKAGTISTGHGLGGSEGDVWGPLPINLGVSPGAQTRSELIASVDRGLLVTTFNYCRVLDPRTLVVTGLTRNGTFLIENGEIAGAVKDLRFTQSFLAALAPDQLLGAGSEARFADSEFGAGLVAAPPLRLAAWHFTGGARG